MENQIWCKKCNQMFDCEGAIPNANWNANLNKKCLLQRDEDCTNIKQNSEDFK